MSSPLEHDAVKSYLSRALLWVFPITETEREEISQELEQHILSLATAEEAKGVAPAGAITQAILRMGDAEDLGKQINKSRLARYAQQPSATTKRSFSTLTIFYLVLNMSISVMMFGIIFVNARMPEFLVIGSLFGILSGFVNLLTHRNLPTPSKDALERMRRWSDKESFIRKLGPADLPRDISKRGLKEYQRQCASVESLSKRMTDVTKKLDNSANVVKTNKMPKSILYLATSILSGFLLRDVPGAEKLASVCAAYSAAAVTGHYTFLAVRKITLKDSYSRLK